MRRTVLSLAVLLGLLVSLIVSPAQPAAAQGPVVSAELNKSFTPVSIIPGQISRLRVAIFNSNPFELTAAGWSDNLLGVQPGLRLGNPLNLTNTCGGAVTAVPGGASLALSGGTVPPLTGATVGSCYVEVDVTSTTPGNLVNTIPAGNLAATGNGVAVSNLTPASATLRVGVVQPPTVTKGFNPSTVYVGQTSQLTVTIRNNDLVTALTNVSLTDVMPANVVIAPTPGISISGCGAGTPVTAIAGSNSLIYSGGGIAANATCTIRVNVVSSTPNAYVNDIPAGSLTNTQGVTNALASAQFNVQAIGIAKAFSPTGIQAGGSSTLTITLRNPTGTPYTNASVSDTLPISPNNFLEYVPGSAATTCGGVASIAGRTLTLAGGTVPAGTIAAPGNCTVTAQVTIPAGVSTATYTNTIAVGAFSASSAGSPVSNYNASSANLYVYVSGGGLSGSKAFSTNPIFVGNNTRMRISLTAPADTALTNFSVTDTLPAGLVITNSIAPTRANCGPASVLTAPTGGDTITLTNGSISAGFTCTIDVYVTGTTPGAYTNSIPPANISNDQSRRPTANIINATPLYVRALSGLTMGKVFYPNAINPNTISALTITLTNTNVEPLTNVSLTDTLPISNASNGIFVAPIPNASTTCVGGAVTAVAGSNTITLAGGNIPAQVGAVPGICTITVDVIGRGSAGARTNTIPATNVSATLPSLGVINAQADASATITIASLSIGVVKNFAPLTIFGGSSSTLSVELSNPTNAQLVGIAFTDTMPAGMVIANPPNLNTGACGGVLTGAPGGGSFSFSGGILNAAQSCVVSLSVTMTVNYNLTNTIPINAVTTANGARNPAAASASLTNLPGASVSKVFSPNPVEAGLENYSLLTITIQNTGNSTISSVGLLDTLPAGLVIAPAPAPAPVNNCGGALTAARGTRDIRLTNGSVDGSSRCTLVIAVSGDTPGAYTNTIPVNSLTNDQNATNSEPAQDTLVLTARPELNITKTAAPATLSRAGDIVTYTILVENTGNVPLNNVTVSDPGAAIGACTPAQPATLARGASMACSATHALTQAEVDAGAFTNTATADSDETPADSDDETVTITPAASISLLKTGTLNPGVVAPAGRPDAGDTITYAFTVRNTGDSTLSNITLADAIPGVAISGGPIALAPGATDSASFTGVYTLTQADINAGTFTNTATVTGNPPSGSPVTDDDDDTQTLQRVSSLGLEKSVTSSGPYTAGSAITYQLVATNTGNLPLTNVTIADSGATLGACTPAQPADLAPGATLTCAASHTLTQAEIDAGAYANAASADSNETGPAADAETVTIPPLPGLQLEKTGALNPGVVAPATRPDVGDTITYTFAVRNTGNVTLTNITLADTVGGVTISGGPVDLVPGAVDSTSFTGIYTLTQADINAGTFTNTAVASGNPPSGSPVTDDDDDTQALPQAPALALEKTITSSGPYVAGDIITYQLVVTNTGNVSLTNVTIADPGAAIGACTPAQPAGLAPGGMLTCAATHTLTQSEVDAGGYRNTATADSDQTPPETDSQDLDIPPLPGLALEKTGALHLDAVLPDTLPNPGDTITYTFRVENTGNVTISNITLADTVGGVSISGGPVTLTPGQVDSSSFTATYTLTQTDIDAGTFTNTAVASGSQPGGATLSASDDDTQTLPQAPALSVEKLVTSSGPYALGSLVTYQITAANTGNVTLTGVAISDPDAAIGACTPTQPADLLPGATLTCDASYTLVQTDVDAGGFTNTASADSDQTTPVDDDASVTVVANPSITLEKTGILNMAVVAPDSLPNPGDTITYIFRVHNTGNVTLRDVRVADTVGGVTVSGGPVTLAPDEIDNDSFTGIYTLTQVDIDAGAFTNTATASGAPPSGDRVTGSDDDTQDLPQSPALALEKRVTSSGPYVAGDDITYALVATNTGNVSLTGVTISDPGATIGACTPAQPAGLAPGATLTCPASHTLTQPEVNSGAFQNTAATGSDQTGPDADSDTQTVVIAPLPALTLEKTGALHLDIVAPDDEANPGDSITYAFTVTNTGNVTLTGVSVTDLVSDVTVSGGPIDLEPGESDSTTFTAAYTLTQADVNAGAFTNTASASGQPPSGSPATDDDDDTQALPAAPALGAAKRVLGEPEAISPGVWRVVYAIALRNYGNVPISALQVTDDLTATFPAGTTFSVLDVRGAGVTVNTAFNGATDTNLLAGADVLDVGANASIELELRIVPAESGPFLNSAIASGETPGGSPTSDASQDGSDPDPDGDGDPANNNEPTPLGFGPNLFDPPAGVKTVDAKRLPVLRWTVIWINNSNIVAIDAASSDPIPARTSFVDDGIPSGYPLPAGPLPAGSTANGVRCTDTSASTSTLYCYYEGPTVEYPRGRVVWQGTLGPDLGAGTPETALNEITIVFAVRATASASSVNNTAVIDSDRNGDGDVDDPGETRTASASATWRRRVVVPDTLPATGFAPGRVTRLPQQPAGLAYAASELALEIPALGLKTGIVSVPLTEKGWQLDWLGAQVGYLEGTAFPTWNGNSALTAHVYDANGRPGPFVNLGSLRWGSQVIVRAFGHTYTYEVRSVRAQVDASEANVIRHEEQPWLTLITCQGYDEASDSYRWRTVVRAVLVKVE